MTTTVKEFKIMLGHGMKTIIEDSKNPKLSDDYRKGVKRTAEAMLNMIYNIDVIGDEHNTIGNEYRLGTAAVSKNDSGIN